MVPQAMETENTEMTTGEFISRGERVPVWGKEGKNSIDERWHCLQHTVNALGADELYT